MVEVQRNHALAADVEGAKGGYARPRLVEPQHGVVRTLADVLRHAAERRGTRGRRPTLPDAKPFSLNAAVSVSQASASVPATGATNCMIARFAMRLCLTGMALDAVAA